MREEWGKPPVEPDLHGWDFHEPRRRQLLTSRANIIREELFFRQKNEVRNANIEMARPGV
jgi:hypothetical protein